MLYQILCVHLSPCVGGTVGSVVAIVVVGGGFVVAAVVGNGCVAMHNDRP